MTPIKFCSRLKSISVALCELNKCHSDRCSTDFAPRAFPPKNSHAKTKRFEKRDFDKKMTSKSQFIITQLAADSPIVIDSLRGEFYHFIRVSYGNKTFANWSKWHPSYPIRLRILFAHTKGVRKEGSKKRRGRVALQNSVYAKRSFAYTEFCKATHQSSFLLQFANRNVAYTEFCMHFILQKRGLQIKRNGSGLQKSHTPFKHSKDRSTYTLLAAKKNYLFLQKKSSIFSLDSKWDPILLKGRNFYRFSSNRKIGYLYATNLEKMSLLSSDLSNLTLSLETYCFLKEKGIHKIGSLVSNSSKALFHLLNRDKKMFSEIKRCLLLSTVCENV